MDLEFSEWQAYLLYLQYIIEYIEKLEEIQANEKFREIEENKLFLYKLIFRKALGDTNEMCTDLERKKWWEWVKGGETRKKVLKNMWDWLDLPPVAPYTPFIGSNELTYIWRKYEINEKWDRSLFLQMERIKIVNTMLLKEINILGLMENKIIESYFPLHDNYQLFGGDKNKKRLLLDPLIEKKIMHEDEITQGQEKLKSMFEDMADEAESTDFDADGSSISDEIAFNWQKPTTIDIDSLRNYYGEKIALYF